jgi:SPP1 gp7 family putative phage head morphogenesis protein
MATSEEYWQKRTKAIVDQAEKKENDTVKELADLYESSQRELEKDLQAFYTKFADKQGLSIDQAKKKVSKTDISNFRKDITRLVKKKELTEKEEEQLALLRAKFTTTRLDLLINEMELKLIDIYGDAQITMEEHLKTVTAETYYQTAGMVAQFAKLPEQEVMDIVNFPWSGAEFSDLLWGHKDRLVKSLRKTVTTGLIRGDSIQEMGRALRDECDNSRYAAERLIRTETAYSLNSATLKGYADNGIEKYEFVAHEDEDTCVVCDSMDGKRFEIKGAKPGIHYPPMHPQDRCYLIAVID